MLMGVLSHVLYFNHPSIRPRGNVGLPENVCGRSRVMGTYVIRTYLGTYVHSEPNSCARMIEHVPARGWNSSTPK